MMKFIFKKYSPQKNFIAHRRDNTVARHNLQIYVAQLQNKTSEYPDYIVYIPIDVLLRTSLN